MNKIGVLFVCFGNICRSPTAEGVFRNIVAKQNLAPYFTIDSCGTAPFNVGKASDQRAIKSCSW
ncbi:MAG: hypothetical protein HRU20_09270 [Pseudomonadales bacterium]|nr:hypothetical protein [Pseudomonadales bacterium]